MFDQADQDGDGSINFDEFASLLLAPEARPLICGKFVGEKKPGETRALRNALLGVDEPLVDNFRGFTSLKDLFETNVKEYPSKKFLGTRAK
jgi:hypothetical protein